MSKVAQIYGGIDLHRTVIQICILDSRGKILEEKRFRTKDLETGHGVVKYLTQWRQNGRFAVEAVGQNRWFVNSCLSQGLDIVVADPVKLDLKKLGKKTDRRDAREIARWLYLVDIDRCALTYYPTDAEYGVRKVLRVRHKLVSVRQQVVNQLRAMFNAYRIAVPRGVLYSPKNLNWLRQCTLQVEDLTASVRVLGSSLAVIQSSIEELDTRITALARQSEVARVWVSLPSVGPQTAITLLYELGDIRRFKSVRAVASYAGLVPKVYNSADTSHHGRLTKRGNRELRWILSEWAVRLMSQDARVREWAEPRLRRMHKNKVRMAPARRLLVGLCVAVSRGETFSLRKLLST